MLKVWISWQFHFAHEVSKVCSTFKCYVSLLWLNIEFYYECNDPLSLNDTDFFWYHLSAISRTKFVEFIYRLFFPCYRSKAYTWPILAVWREHLRVTSQEWTLSSLTAFQLRLKTFHNLLNHWTSQLWSKIYLMQCYLLWSNFKRPSLWKTNLLPTCNSPAQEMYVIWLSFNDKVEVKCLFNMHWC